MNQMETIVEAIIQNMIADPHATSLVYGDEVYSRRQLFSKADQIARDLKTAHIGKGDRVLVNLPRSPRLIAATIGVMLAGATYVPVDIGQPKRRLKGLLELIRPAAIIGDPSLVTLLGESSPPVVRVSDEFSSASLDHLPEVASILPQDDAYVICTSGSTGTPKGVCVSHAALANYASWAITEYGMRQLDGACLSSGIGFDGTLLSQIVPLAAGCPILIVPEGQDIEFLADLLQPGNRWNGLINSSPSLLDAVNPLVDSGVDDTRQCIIVVGGESLTSRSLAPWIERFPCSTFINEYGPTETTIACSYHRITTEDLENQSVPIGRSIKGMQLTIVDSDLRSLADGEKGEILISGRGVAEGYLGQEDLTAERFISHPITGERAYRSGDIGYRDPQGAFHFAGRIDDQIKLRGFRIELEEVRRGLAEWPQLAASTVVLHQTDKISQLVAFGVRRTDSQDGPDLLAMSSFLADRLPEYMIPSRLLLVERFPLTASGKIDCKQLLVFMTPQARHIDATASDITGILAEIWDELLGCRIPAQEDNFFELGGNSVKAMQMIALVKKRLQVALRPAQVFENFRFGALVALIASPPEAKDKVGPSRSKQVGPAIAIIGIGLNFPGAEGWREFWKNLVEKKESITFFSEDELDATVRSVAREPGYVKARGIIANADEFDAEFFRMTPGEASLLDPQHRLFLEVCWQALEEAGYPPAGPQKIGVFAGCGSDTYTIQNVVPKAIADGDLVDLPTRLFNDKDYLTSRVSHKFNLTGPSVNVNTACSTSLVATVLAVKALRDGLCDMALAGGVSVDVPIRAGYRYVEGGMLSPDGHCRPFDHHAGGTTFNSGAGAVLLKPLDRALDDKDNILGVIRGVGINNDGADKSSFAAPSTAGQAGVIRMALDDAGVSPDALDFIETHGTGTPIGDPMEVEALQRAFDGGTSRTGYCALGSVKSNVGHLVAASGIAGLIKAVLSLKQGMYPATLHFEEPNPHIDFLSTPFFVASDHVRLPVDERLVRCGVSSFGVGGTNAHVVLESLPTSDFKMSGCAITPVLPYRIFPFSARSESSLATAMKAFLTFAESGLRLDLADCAYTLQQRRAPMRFRATVVADSVESLRQALRQNNALVEFPKQRLPVVFMFSGQGSQYPGMGRELAAKYPAFASALEECFEVIGKFRGVDFPDLLLGEPNEAKVRELAHTANAQPAIVAMEYGIYSILSELGVKPDRVLGHSVGEFTAAVVAGVMSLEDALAAVCERGRLMGEQPTGSMLAVLAPISDVEQYCSEHVELAACNAPNAHVLSGPYWAVDKVATRLEAAAISAKRLNTSHAFHSNMMVPALEPMVAHMQSIQLSVAKLELISTATVEIITDQMTDPRYWGDQLRHTVRFVNALEVGARVGRSIWIEVGPGTHLTTLTRQKLAQDKHVVIPACSRSDDGEEYGFCYAIAQLWRHGVDIDWTAMQPESGKIVSLPTYSFTRKRHWIDVPVSPSLHQSDVGAACNGSEGANYMEDIIQHQIETMETQLHLLARLEPHDS